MLTETSVRTTKLPSGEAVPVLGQGTWHLAEARHRHKEEVQALRLGLDLGMTLIDTAEMYAEGGAEELVGEAIEGRRKDVFLVSKVLPHNATVRGTMLACDRSLRRLRTNHLDLYLLHWRGSVPFGTYDHCVRCAGQGGKNPLLGCQQLRHFRYGRGGSPG